MSVQFEVTPNLQPFSKEKPSSQTVRQAIKKLGGIDPEAFDDNGGGTVLSEDAHPNGFFHAVHMAFQDHIPLVLRPDDVWLAISQGFALHVGENAEKLRSRFVKYEGKTKLRIRRDGFIKGHAENDWPGAFAEFSGRIAEHVGEHQRKLLVANFSTTRALEKAVSELTLMNTLKSYFDFEVLTKCGIPSITLLGDREDWESIEDRIQVLAEYDCKEWIEALSDVIGYFVTAFDGHANPRFWQSFYKKDDMSGGPYTTGVVNVFFPYIINWRGGYRPNTAALNWIKGYTTTDMIPGGLASVPFVWDYMDRKFDMNFLGGFVGAGINTDNHVLPIQGWGITESKSNV